MTRVAEPQVSFADLEFSHQGVVLDPMLEAISTLLKEQGEMIEHVRGDLQRGLKNPATGRNGLTPDQVLRALVLKQV